MIVHEYSHIGLDKDFCVCGDKQMTCETLKLKIKFLLPFFILFKKYPTITHYFTLFVCLYVCTYVYMYGCMYVVTFVFEYM